MTYRGAAGGSATGTVGTGVIGHTRLAGPGDRAAISDLRQAAYAGASEFALVAGADLGWHELDDDSAVIAAWQGPTALSTLRGTVVSGRAAAECVLTCTVNLGPEWFPALILTKAATRSGYSRMGLHSILRYHLLTAAAAQGARSVLGLVYAGAPRVRTMQEIGYRFSKPARVWDPEGLALKPPLLAVLSGDSLPSACSHLAEACHDSLDAFPWSGPVLKLPGSAVSLPAPTAHTGGNAAAGDAPRRPVVRQIGDGWTAESVRNELAGAIPDIGALWELCLRAEYDQARLVTGVSSWLGRPGTSRILDASCGSGFPALDLISRGYDVTCVDGSAAMLRRFDRAAQTRGLPVRALQRRWEDLSEEFGPVFDVVMCRGNSLIYAGTWDEDIQPDRGVLERSVRGLVGCLRPGGRWYSDTTRAGDLAAPSAQSTAELELADGGRVLIEERIDMDPRERVRTWRARASVGGFSRLFTRRSHLLGHSEFATMLTAAGLVDVHREHVDGEHYDVFVGGRPAGGNGIP